MDNNRATIQLEGERRLVLAILEEAVRSYQHNAFAASRRGRRLFREACDWFEASDDPWIFSFENICYVLDLDPGHIRSGLEQWRAKEALRPSWPIAHHYLVGLENSVLEPTVASGFGRPEGGLGDGLAGYNGGVPRSRHVSAAENSTHFAGADFSRGADR